MCFCEDINTVYIPHWLSSFQCVIYKEQKSIALLQVERLNTGCKLPHHLLLLSFPPLHLVPSLACLSSWCEIVVDNSSKPGLCVVFMS